MLFWHSHLGENPQKCDQTRKSVVIKVLLKSELSEEETVSVHIWAVVKRSEVIRKGQWLSVMDSYGICLSRHVRCSHLISKHCNGPGCWNTSLDNLFFSWYFFFFSLSYPNFLAKDRECDSVVNPESEGIIVLIHTAYIVLRIFSFFAIVF